MFENSNIIKGIMVAFKQFHVIRSDGKQGALLQTVLTIQYFAANERIILIDQAKVIQEGNTFEGEKIVYDTQRQIVNAGRATNVDVTSPRPRVDMVIQPRKKEGSATGTPAAEQSE